MTRARPLQVVLDELAGGDLAADPAGALAASGHGDLPDSLVAEAIVNYADTAPVEVAEHLAPFVQAHGPVPGAGPAEPEVDLSAGLALVASAPPTPGLDGPDDFAADLSPAAGGEWAAGEFGAGDDGLDGAVDGDPFGLDFGGGDQADPAGALALEWDQPWDDGPATELTSPYVDPAGIESEFFGASGSADSDEPDPSDPAEAG